jgi:hypothetical protein
MRYVDLWLPILIGILGVAAWMTGGQSSHPHAQTTEDDDPDHNHGSKL